VLTYIINFILHGVQLFHANGQTHRGIEGQTDMTKLIVDLRNFADAPKMFGFMSELETCNQVSVCQLVHATVKSNTWFVTPSSAFTVA